MPRECPKDWPEVIARLVDSNDDGDMDNPVTSGLVEALSKCDLLIGGVLRYITDENTVHDDAYWWAIYAREDPQPTDMAEARRRLADLFGGVHVEGLQEALNSAVRSRHLADENWREALSKKHAAENKLRDVEARERNLVRVLAYGSILARTAWDKTRDPLGAAILGAIAEYEDVWNAVEAKARELADREATTTGGA